MERNTCLGRVGELLPREISVGVAIITHNARHHLQHCLPPLIQSPLKPRILVVNSSSNDGTVETAQQMGVETLILPRCIFNHGTTRETARKHLNTDIVVMMTPDAYAVDATLLEKLIEPLLLKQSSISYARQIPHKGAGFFESFPRFFNYPAESQCRGIEDLSKYGAYTYFCSNSCAAYLNKALDEIGGFSHVLLGEDTLATAHLLKRGHKVAYAAEAVVYHSHEYSLKAEFKRSFDTGLMRKQHETTFFNPVTDLRRGMQLTRHMSRELLAKHPLQLPYGLVQSAVKYLGYRLGKLSYQAPVWFKKRLSSQDFYWNSKKN